MGFDVVLHKEPGEEYVEVDARLCLTEDGERLVPEGDPDARWLFCTPGQKIPRREAEKYGLIDAKGKPIEAREGIEVPIGETATVEGDGSGEALPPHEAVEEPELAKSKKASAKKRAAKRVAKGSE